MELRDSFAINCKQWRLEISPSLVSLSVKRPPRNSHKTAIALTLGTTGLQLLLCLHNAWVKNGSPTKRSRFRTKYAFFTRHRRLLLFFTIFSRTRGKVWAMKKYKVWSISDLHKFYELFNFFKAHSSKEFSGEKTIVSKHVIVRNQYTPRSFRRESKKCTATLQRNVAHNVYIKP